MILGTQLGCQPSSCTEGRGAEEAVAILQAAEAALDGTQKTLQGTQGQLRDTERQLGDTAADLQSSKPPRRLAFALLVASTSIAAMAVAQCLRL